MADAEQLKRLKANMTRQRNLLIGIMIGIPCFLIVLSLAIEYVVNAIQAPSPVALQATASAFAVEDATLNAQSTSTAVADVSATANVESLLRVAETVTVRDPGPPYSPYIAGKMLVVDYHSLQSQPIDIDGDGVLGDDPSNYLVPTNRMATTPDQVGAIIRLSCSARFVGTYKVSNGEQVSGYARDCDVTIIDRAKGLVVGINSFEGPDPPSKTICYSPCMDIYGPYPGGDIAKYLLGLPSK